jgi:hypothetical protein
MKKMTPRIEGLLWIVSCTTTTALAIVCYIIVWIYLIFCFSQMPRNIIGLKG